jgi:hypothetical protein
MPRTIIVRILKLNPSKTQALESTAASITGIQPEKATADV